MCAPTLPAWLPAQGECLTSSMRGTASGPLRRRAASAAALMVSQSAAPAAAPSLAATCTSCKEIGRRQVM